MRDQLDTIGSFIILMVVCVSMIIGTTVMFYAIFKIAIIAVVCAIMGVF